MPKRRRRLTGPPCPIGGEAHGGLLDLPPNKDGELLWACPHAAHAGVAYACEGSGSEARYVGAVRNRATCAVCGDEAPVTDGVLARHRVEQGHSRYIFTDREATEAQEAYWRSQG